MDPHSLQIGKVLFIDLLGGPRVGSGCYFGLKGF